MYGWRERSPIRYPKPKRLKSSESLSQHQQRSAQCSDLRGPAPIAPLMEYRYDNAAEQRTQSLTLRAFTDGLPSQGDLRNFLKSKQDPPKEKHPGIIEHIVQDYRYPQTCHEIKMVRQNFAGDSVKNQLRLTEDGLGSLPVDTLGANPSTGIDSMSHNTTVFMRNDIVDGDQDDKQKFKDYVQKRPMTSDDFESCRCRGEGVQVWMRLCGCGCRCARCRAVVRYKHPRDDDGEEDDDDPLGWN